MSTDKQETRLMIAFAVGCTLLAPTAYAVMQIGYWLAR